MSVLVTSGRPIGVFLHVATLGRYNEVSDEVLLALRTSELFAQVDFVEVSVVGEGPLSLPYADERLRVVRRSPVVTAFEHPTLESLRQYCRATTKASVLYLNCLGGRHVGDGYRIRAEWRKLLAYLLIDRASSCLAALERYDVCGVDWSNLPLPHMTSNNWWARADYIASLPSPSEVSDIVAGIDLSRFGPSWLDEAAKRRHAGEFWIGMNPAVRPVGMLNLKSLGLPTSEYDSVPWWGLPGVRWEAVARRKYGDRTWSTDDARFAFQLVSINALFFLKYLKRIYVRRHA